MSNLLGLILLTNLITIALSLGAVEKVSAWIGQIVTAIATATQGK